MDWVNLNADVNMILNKHYTKGRSGYKVNKIVVHYNAGNLSIAGCYSVWQTIRLRRADELVSLFGTRTPLGTQATGLQTAPALALSTPTIRTAPSRRSAWTAALTW